MGVSNASIVNMVKEQSNKKAGPTGFFVFDYSTITVGEILAQGCEHLKKAGIENPRFESEILLAHCLKQDRVILYTFPEQQLDKRTIANYEDLIKKRKYHMPYAYIVGEKEFMGLTFKVNEHVLIPRPDTESLVIDFIETFKDTLTNYSSRILDLCTGSGAIGLSIAKLYPKTEVTLSDVSIEALSVARHNKHYLDLHNVKILRSNLFNELTERCFDFIISNPPYIESGAIKNLQTEIVDYEPHSALDGGKDGLNYYRRIIEQAPTYLKPGGYLLLELGDGQYEAVKKMTDKSRFKFMKAIPDLSQTLRGILLRRM